MLYQKNKYIEDFCEKYEDLDLKGLNNNDVRIGISLALFIFAAGIFSIGLFYPFMVYQRAGAAVLSGDFDAAIQDYQTIDFYRDSAERLTESVYQKGLFLLNEGEYPGAKEIFIALSKDRYKDSLSLLKECNYHIAGDFFAKEDYRSAAGFFLALKDYKDSHIKYIESVYYLILQENLNGRVQESLRMLPILQEAGYFTYSTLPEDDYAAALKLVKTTAVNLYADFDAPSSEWEYYTGSACVYKITPDFLYFLTARHVLETIGKNPVELTFYNGAVITIIPEYMVADDERSDLAMFRVATAEIPIETLVTLKEINFSTDYYHDLTEGREAFLYAAHWFQKEDLISDTEFLSLNAELYTDGYYDSDNFIVFARCSENGQSGCPVFDYTGRCLALSSGYYYRKTGEEITYTVDCYARLDQAEELYKKAPQ